MKKKPTLIHHEKLLVDDTWPTINYHRSSIYINYKDVLLCYDAVSHEKKWEFVADSKLKISCPNDHAVLIPSKNCLYSLDPETGKVTWELKILQGYSGILDNLGDKFLISISHIEPEKKFFQLRWVKSGELLWEKKFEARPYQQKGKLFSTQENGNVQRISVEDGDVIASIDGKSILYYENISERMKDPHSKPWLMARTKEYRLYQKRDLKLIRGIPNQIAAVRADNLEVVWRHYIEKSVDLRFLREEGETLLYSYVLLNDESEDIVRLLYLDTHTGKLIKSKDLTFVPRKEIGNLFIQGKYLYAAKHYRLAAYDLEEDKVLWKYKDRHGANFCSSRLIEGNRLVVSNLECTELFWFDLP